MIKKLRDFHRHSSKVSSKEFHLSGSQVTTSFESPSVFQGGIKQGSHQEIKQYNHLIYKRISYLISWRVTFFVKHFAIGNEQLPFFVTGLMVPRDPGPLSRDEQVYLFFSVHPVKIGARSKLGVSRG
ncbi:MAG TPA: hypothetical protein VF905_06715, partial [Nitrospirota bacterium]